LQDNPLKLGFANNFYTLKLSSKRKGSRCSLSDVSGVATGGTTNILHLYEYYKTCTSFILFIAFRLILNVLK